MEWKSTFPTCQVFNKVVFRSDCSPTLLVLKYLDTRRRNWFKFEETWQEYLEYKDVINEIWVWEIGSRDELKLGTCHQELSKWSKETFGHYHARSMNIKERMQEIQLVRDNSNHHDEETNLKAELERLLQRKRNILGPTIMS